MPRTYTPRLAEGEKRQKAGGRRKGSPPAPPTPFGLMCAAYEEPRVRLRRMKPLEFHYKEGAWMG